MVVRIFRQVSKQDYASFTVAYYHDEVRKREVLSNFALAKKRAKKLAEALADAGCGGGAVDASSLESHPKITFWTP